MSREFFSMQVSNLMFEACFKVKIGHLTKKVLCLPNYWPRAQFQGHTTSTIV